MPDGELVDAIDQCYALARHLHGLVQDAECHEAQELGIHPQVGILPPLAPGPRGQLTAIQAILQQLADGRTSLLQELRSRHRDLDTIRQERDRAIQQGGALERKPLAPRDALKRRINELIQGIGSPGGPPPPAPATTDDRPESQAMTMRLRQMEQEAEHRQLLVEKLIQKAFEQGDLISDLRERLDRINAMTADADTAQMRALRESMDRDEILVIPDEEPDDDDDLFP